jgi:class 3 adenylate cyclase
MKRRNYIWLLCSIMMLLSACSSDRKHAAQKGVLDISAIDLNTEKPLALNGEWAFYWHQLYTPADLAAHHPAMTGYIEVPVFWNAQKINGKKYPWQGYATYRLKIKTANKGLLGIKILDPNSAYKLWINGQLIATEGVVGRSKKEEAPKLTPAIKIFENKETELDIVLQVSNFFHNKAGVWQPITISTEKNIIRAWDASILLSMCLAGMFLILAIYNLFIFLLRRAEYSAFIFSGLSLCFAIRVLVIEERPILFFFPNLSTDLLHRLQYESIFAACVFFTGFIYSILQKDYPWKVMRLMIILSVVELFIISFAPVHIYTLFLRIFQLKVFIQALYSFYILGKSIKKKRRWAKLLLVLLSIVFIGGVNDTLYTNARIHTGYQMQYYAFFILLVQAYIIATRVSGAYFKFSRLTTELNEANLGLEQKVIDRTEELGKEKKKADELLLNILPAQAAEELKLNGQAQARAYKMVTVMLIDMVGFTRVSEQISAELLVAEIDECFKAFDAIVEQHNIEKIKTIGDAYLCVGGLPEPNETHANDVLHAAMKISEYMTTRYRQKELNDEVAFQVRIGVHSGPVIAGIVGTKKFSYDVWGDTVNIAADMEQRCQPEKINVSQSTYQLLGNDFAFTHHGAVETKDNDIVQMYFAQKITEVSAV